MDIIAPDHTPEWELQPTNDTCAVISEMSIINQFGHELTAGEATYISASNGWYIPGEGTDMAHLGNMMDMYGISNHSVSNATVSDLARELQAGHGVIVCVNSEELSADGPLAELWQFIKEHLGLDSAEFSPADHAVVVTGIDVSDSANPQVIINDSGNPDGEALRYPLDKFMDAWENSNFSYTATDAPMPGTNEEELKNVDFTDWLVDAAKEFAPTLVGSVVTFGASSMGLDPITSTGLGKATTNLIENFFDSPDSIDMV